MKRKKTFSVLSIVFTGIALLCVVFVLLDFIYIFNLDKGLSFIFVGLYFVFIAFVQLLLTIVFGVLGGVFSVLTLKRQGVKPFHVTTLAVSAALVTISISSIILALCLAYFG